MADDSVLFLGTSDAIPGWDRSHACLVLRLAGQSIVLDCGEPAAKNMAFECVDFGGIEAIALSHLHADHVAGLLQVITAMWLVAKRDRDIPVYLPAEGIETFRRLLDTTYLFPELIKFNVDLRPLKAREPFAVGPVQVTPHRTTHLDSIRRLGGERRGIACEPFLLEVAANGKRLVYSGDLGSARDLEPTLDRPLDLLICECAHVTPESLFETLRDRPVKHLVITHINHLIWDDHGRLMELARRFGYAERCTIARDGLMVSL
ncbi:MAG: MBL fold metallo-hydrolase [Verrucomicrobia bacterium]|nr:MBL fold metallo-hydrolase [Verrucomicrobiota bacterium]